MSLAPKVVHSNDHVYKIILVAITWLFSLIMTWMTATASMDSHISGAIKAHEEASATRLANIEARLISIDFKVDTLTLKMLEKK